MFLPVVSSPLSSLHLPIQCLSPLPLGTVPFSLDLDFFSTYTYLKVYSSVCPLIPSMLSIYPLATPPPPPPLPCPPSNVLPLFSHCYPFIPHHYFSHSLSHTKGLIPGTLKVFFFDMDNPIDQSFVIISMVFLDCLVCIFTSSQAYLVPFLFGFLLFVSFSFSALSLFQLLFFYFIFVVPFYLTHFPFH